MNLQTIYDNTVGIFKNNQKYNYDGEHPIFSRKQNDLVIAIVHNNYEYVIQNYNEVWIWDDLKKQILFADALLWADMRIIRFLEQKYNVKKNFIENDEYFKIAIKHNRNIDVIKYMIDELKMNLDYFDHRHVNCLMIACEHNCLDVVKYLIEERKMDPNCQDIYGHNCLIKSMEGHKPEIITYLSDKMDIVYAVKKICDTDRPIKYRVHNTDYYVYRYQISIERILLFKENYFALNYLLEHVTNIYGKQVCCMFLRRKNINPLMFKKNIWKICNIRDPFTLDYTTFKELVDNLNSVVDI